ncbi:alpha/beta hydrolase fold domain-containing protein [Aeromicrobium sp. CF4.19]|uniref:alpha/beta hydrolase fold domain-containing protein n=1 Tax=Aeromicrobium sp. CF4.19 TaxID=3373082 RepID=UPI003EE52067
MRRGVVAVAVGAGATALALRVRRTHAMVARVAPDLRERSLYVPLSFRGPLLRPLRRVLAIPTPIVDGVVHTEHAPRPGRDGHVPTAHVYRPDGWDGGAALLWMHGGGYIAGAAARDHTPCSELARDLGILVVSVEYRLAPEHPFPAALDDCHAVAEWLVTTAGMGVDPGRVAVAGASAGGGLAAALVHRLVDEGPLEPALQLLIYPMLDDRTVLGPTSRGPRLVWTPGSNRFAWQSYLGTRPGARDLPEHAAPARREDLTGLPPTWIGVGDIDLFHDEDVEHARRLREAGVPVKLDVVPGMHHAADISHADRATTTAGFRARVRTALREGLDL